MAIGENGTLFVGTRGNDRVYAVRDEDGDGRAETAYPLLTGLDGPNGVAVSGGDLYVAESGRILRYPAIEQNLENPPQPLEVARLPAYSHHGWRYLGVGPDGKLYVPLGAPCNVCDKPEFASILRMNKDGSEREVFAEGVRNTVGFTWHPVTRELWFTDNGRDWMGDQVPPDEVNRAPRPGLHFGFPFCHGGDVADPEFGDQKPCRLFEPPVVKLPAHVAPLGLRFYTGDQFPEDYRQQLFIAEHGSWNRSEPIGYRVSLVRFDTQGNPLGVETFAGGWLGADGEVRGRPVDVLVTPDGALLVSDDKRGAIYRISYEPAAG
jgi:glucose/arabinose dehydrogenase